MLNPIEKFKVAILHLKIACNHWMCLCVKSFHMDLAPIITLCVWYQNSLVHSSPKETQLFWWRFSFGKECRLVKWWNERFHLHTHFPKRNPTFKIITEFALAAMGFQLLVKIIKDAYSDYWLYWDNCLIFFRQGLLIVTSGNIFLGWHDLESLTLVRDHYKKSGN